MRHLKRFNESNDTKYVLVTYDKTIDGYPEKTAIIVDGDNKIVDSIDFLFKMGEYSEETKEKMSRYNISGRTVADGKDFYMVDGVDISQEEALRQYVDHLETIKRVNNFLTPEKQEELINLFRKRRK